MFLLLKFIYVKFTTNQNIDAKFVLSLKFSV